MSFIKKMDLTYIHTEKIWETLQISTPQKVHPCDRERHFRGKSLGAIRLKGMAY